MYSEQWQLTQEDLALTDQLKQARERMLFEDKPTVCDHFKFKRIIALVDRRMNSSRTDLRSPLFWRAAGAEFLGTALLVFIGCGAWVGSTTALSKASFEDLQPDPVQVAIAFGMAVTVIVMTIGHLSGGHINPAVTFAMIMSRRISLARCVVYIAAQCLGALTGASILYGLTPASVRGNIGSTTIHEAITPAQSFTIECLLAFFLVLTIFAASDRNRNDRPKTAPLAAGVATMLCHLHAIRFTGASMNPARSFGPAIVSNTWKSHWIYWFGPFLGAALGALLYDNFFAVNSSLSKAKAYFLAENYEPDKHEPGVRESQEMSADDNNINVTVIDTHEDTETETVLPPTCNDANIRDDKLRVTEVEFCL